MKCFVLDVCRNRLNQGFPKVECKYLLRLEKSIEETILFNESLICIINYEVQILHYITYRYQILDSVQPIFLWNHQKKGCLHLWVQSLKNKNVIWVVLSFASLIVGILNLIYLEIYFMLKLIKYQNSSVIKI